LSSSGNFLGAQETKDELFWVVFLITLCMRDDGIEVDNARFKRNRKVFKNNFKCFKNKRQQSGGETQSSVSHCQISYGHSFSFLKDHIVYFLKGEFYFLWVILI